MPAKSATKSAKVAVKTAKTAKVVETTVKVPAQLPAAQLPAAPAVKEAPMWNGKPISAAGLVYHQRREAGVCVKCGQPLDPASKLLCPSHLAYHNSWHGARKARINAAMELLKKQEGPVTTAQIAEVTAAAVVDVAPTTKTAKAKVQKSKAVAALKASQPAKTTKKSSKK